MWEKGLKNSMKKSRCWKKLFDRGEQKREGGFEAFIVKRVDVGRDEVDSPGKVIGRARALR